MMRRVLLAVLLAACACGIRNPVRNSVTISPDEDRRHVTVTARTEFLDDGKEDEERARLAELRTAILEGRDSWTPRFALVNAESERVSYEKTRGLLRVAEHTAKIRVEDLQRLLSEFGTVQFTEGDHWTEFAIYPSASTRATRQQREHVESAMHRWAGDAARYFRALDHLYAYLEREPQREKAVFTVLMSDKSDEKSTVEEEDALITAVTGAIDVIVKHIDDARSHGVTLDEEFDLVFNPLPAEVIVRVPQTVDAIEGFQRRDERTFVIQRRGLIEAILSLENRWVTPDPLAIAARASYEDKPDPKAEEFAAMPRRSSPGVTAAEIEEALAEKLRPAAAYRVRWERARD